MSSTRIENDDVLDSAADEATGSPERPMRKDAARNRALLIAAAREVFARRGMEASLDEIAKQAGVGVGTAYRHFANKHDLAAALMHDAIDAVVVEAERACEADDPWDGLVDFLEAVLVRQTQDRYLREVMMGVHDPSKADHVDERLLGPIGRLIARAQAAGEMRADAAQSDLGFVVMMLCNVADVAGEVDTEMWRRYLPILLAGLRPGGPPLVGTPFTNEQFHEAAGAHHARTVRAAKAAGCG